MVFTTYIATPYILSNRPCGRVAEWPFAQRKMREQRNERNKGNTWLTTVRDIVRPTRTVSFSVTLHLVEGHKIMVRDVCAQCLMLVCKGHHFIVGISSSASQSCEKSGDQGISPTRAYDPL